MRKRKINEAQLSLFEPNEPEAFVSTEAPSPSKSPSVLEFIRARLDHGPDLTQEEYKRWIKIIIQHSLKRME